jgi:hypothetical protein
MFRCALIAASHRTLKTLNLSHHVPATVVHNEEDFLFLPSDNRTAAEDAAMARFSGKAR